MGNMDYCRFQNTVSDLRECQDAMDERDLSPNEKHARKEMIKVCQEIARDYGDEDDE